MSDYPNLAIVAIAYNRPDSLLRLLNSLEKVDFEGHYVPLIISIDFSGSNEVKRVADSFEWKYGEKRIIAYQARLGLKKHVLSCGDLVENYDAIVVLEDDLIVSPAMYSYAWRAVKKYMGEERITGISLYSKLYSETAFKPFMASLSGYDTFFIQTMESWGQIWFREQWRDFRKWYDTNDEPFGMMDGIPANVCAWGENSWKKYYIRYCIEKDKYTVYPYMALSTCMGDAGEHFNDPTTVYQVPLVQYKKQNYQFADFYDEKAVKYDAYLERVRSENKDVCFDLYGKKQNYGFCRYVVTPNSLPYKQVASYGLTLRPHEENILAGIPGKDFLEYDLTEKTDYENKRVVHRNVTYYNFADVEFILNSVKTKKLIDMIWKRIKKKFGK